jgi:outer membrane lipoprotein carrier protein
MKRITVNRLLAAATFWIVALMASPVPAAATALDTLLDGLEARYDQPGFAADFDQQSTVKALEITDRAKGRLMVRKPGQMRWEYTAPDPQLIVSDGQSLWIYRPADKQVLTGKAPKFFGDGKGAGFLSDIKVLRRKFEVTLLPERGDGLDTLRLVPQEKTLDIAEIELAVNRGSGLVERIVTINAYGDVTRIALSNMRFENAPDPALFRFEVPKGVEVLPLEGQ